MDLDRWCLTPSPVWVGFEGEATGCRFVPFEWAAVVIVGVRMGEAGIGVNGVNVNGEVRLELGVRGASPLFCVRVSEVGRSESNCNREPERLLRRVDDAGIE